MKFYLNPLARQNKIIPPQSPREGDAGYDLRSALDIDILPGEQVLVSTGLHVAIPVGWVALLKERSSMAKKRLYVHSGVIDAGYRGENIVILENGNSQSVHIDKNDKIVQMVIVPHYTYST